MFQHLQQFEKDDVSVGSLIGNGSFYDIFDVSLSKICLKRQKKYGTTGDSNLDEPVVLKKIKGLNYYDGKQNTAYLNLVHETDLLSSLNHRNIVKIHGSGQQFLGSTSGQQYFIIIGRIKYTLEKQLRIWHTDETSCDGVEIPTHRRNKELNTRLKVAVSIASALSYLHSRDIVFRDLKPSNIGFDFKGEVKLIDFQSAIEIKPETTINHFYGSPRYMAPEVYRRNDYKFPVDVYSFGILLWEIYTLKKPYRDLSLKTLRRKVIEGYRPKLQTQWSMTLKNVMTASWNYNPIKRPSISTIHKVLQNETIGTQELFSKRQTRSLLKAIRKRRLQ